MNDEFQQNNTPEQPQVPSMPQMPQMPDVPPVPSAEPSRPAYTPPQAPHPTYTPPQQPSYTPPQQPVQPVQQPVPTYVQQPVQQSKKTNGLAVASLICGILSLVCCCCGYLTLPLGIAAIILAICSRKGDAKMSGLAIAGLVCGIIGATIGLLIVVAGLTGAGQANSILQQFKDEFGQGGNDFDWDDFSEFNWDDFAHILPRR